MKNIKSVEEFNEGVYSNEGHAGMNGERYTDKLSKKELISKISKLKYFGTIAEQPGFDSAKKDIIEILKKEL